MTTGTRSTWFTMSLPRAVSRSASPAHPEVHPRSASRTADRRHLADKLRLADFAITQFFFEVEHWQRLVDELSALGVDKPIVPGIMPVTNLASVHRMAQMSGTAVPTWLTERLERCSNPEQVRRLGVEIAIELCRGLVEAGAPGLHLYTLNKASDGETDRHERRSGLRLSDTGRL